MAYKDKQAAKEYNKRYRQSHKEEIAEREKRYRQEHREEIAERKKRYYQEHKEYKAERGKRRYQSHKDEIAEQVKRYYQEHKEEHAERCKRYQQSHKDEIAEWQKRYRQEHKEELAEYHARYRQTHQHRFEKFGTKIIDTKISPMDAYKRFGGLCWICGGLCDPNDKFINRAGGIGVGASYPTKDHITPIAKGGEESWDNVLLAHKSCNAWRKTKSVEDVKKELENPTTLEMLRRRLTKKEVVL